MNEKAAALGMTNTRFLEPTGLDSGNVSTAHDLALMVNAAYAYPLIREFTTSDLHEVPTAGRRHHRAMSPIATQTAWCATAIGRSVYPRLATSAKRAGAW